MLENEVADTSSVRLCNPLSEAVMHPELNILSCPHGRKFGVLLPLYVRRRQKCTPKLRLIQRI